MHFVLTLICMGRVEAPIRAQDDISLQLNPELEEGLGKCMDGMKINYKVNIFSSNSLSNYELFFNTRKVS